MHTFVERTTPERDRRLQITAARAGLETLARDGLEAVTLTRIAELLTVAESSRSPSGPCADATAPRRG